MDTVTPSISNNTPTYWFHFFKIADYPLFPPAATLLSYRPDNVRGYKPEHGFSVVELLVVIVLIAILASVTIPRFFGTQSFTNSNIQTNLQSALNFTRNRATTTQCTLELRITTTGWAVWQDDDCQSTGNSGTGCTEPLNFITAVLAPGESTQLTGALSSTSLERLFFTPTGRLYRSTTAGDCINLPANPVPSGTQIVGLTPATTLRLDGVTGYVELQ